MSRRNRRNNGGSSNNNNQQDMDLKLNLSVSPTPARRGPPGIGIGIGIGMGRNRISTSSSESEVESCLSSEESLKYSSSPEATSMVLVGCPRCLMYVMLSESDPRCPKCKSTVLLDFLRTNRQGRSQEIGPRGTE